MSKKHVFIEEDIYNCLKAIAKHEGRTVKGEVEFLIKEKAIEHKKFLSKVNGTSRNK